jgi:diguanylate cyclase (GGDEF)-like protein/PAS domain S-box-containing protein
VRESEERYAIAASAGDDGLWDWNLETNEVYFSPRWKSMLGYEENEIDDSPDEWLKRVHSKDLGRLLGRLSDHLHRGAERFESEHRVLHRDGGYRWMLARGIAVRENSGTAVRLVGWLTDITARKRNEDRLKHDAWHDALTDLPNRAYFSGQLQRAATRSYGGSQQGFALLYLDVDNFKELNDGLGHTVGDQVLIAIANRLKHSVRPGDTIARIGGDEFAILLARLGDEREASHIAERIQKALSLPVKIGEHELSISVSIGVALSSLSNDKPGDFLRDADLAMYEAKAGGGGRHRIFEKGEGSGISGAGLGAADLGQAIEQGQFRVVYEPALALPALTVTGCTASLLWDHPSRGPLAWESFQGPAAQQGLSDALLRWLLKDACSRMKAWLDAGLSPGRLTIKVDHAWLRQPPLLETVRETLSATGLEAKALRIELTENALLESGSETWKQLEGCVDAGLQIAVGELGMEYSSLIYLKRRPISMLKIDGLLVRDVPADMSSATITGGLIELAHSLGLKVSIGGINTPEQLAFLRAKRCDEFQGPIISAPVAAEAFEDFIRRHGDLSVSELLSSAS